MPKNKLFSIIFTTCTHFLGICTMSNAEDSFEYYGKIGIGADTIPAETLIVIKCGKGRVEISCETGIAKFIDCTVDEATKALWDGLRPHFEAWKEVISKKKEADDRNVKK